MIGLKQSELKGKPFADIFGLALNRETFNEMRQRINDGTSIDNLVPRANSKQERNHRAKIIREEATKQFKEGYRPIVELVLNAIDAKPDDQKGDYVVDIELNGKSISVLDRGTGMGLEETIINLLTPFYSERDANADLGRFGVGFLSTLDYCARNPGRKVIEVDTSRNGNRYLLDFGSKTDSIEDLLVDIKSSSNSQNGTRIKLNFGYKKKELSKYLSKYLDFFDLERAKIKVNGRIINKSSPNERIYELHVNGENEELDLRIGFENVNKGGKTSLYSQGIFIKSNDFPGYKSRIDFPSQVLPVEGRDEFKHDNNYSLAVRGIIGFVCENKDKLKKEVKGNFDPNDFLINFIDTCSISHNGLESLLGDNIDKLFGGKIYLIKDCDNVDDYVNVIDFFGEEIKDSLYFPRTDRSYNFWERFLPGFKELLKDNVNYLDKSSVDFNSFLGLKGLDINCFASPIYPFTLKSPANTRSPFIGNSRGLGVNIKHPLINQDSFVARYMVASYFYRLVLNEENLDNKIIN